jgi:hypothetical protein
MQRLRLHVDVCADSEVYVRLTPGPRIGAVPLVGPATRRIVAGIPVEPRFRWPALGAVFNSIGFTVEPAFAVPPGPGLRAGRAALRWAGPVQSMGSLAPDVELRSAERVVWIDARYKPHLQLLAHRGWSGVSEEIRREHRADLHQALAYASLADAAQVDTLLLYPSMGSEPRRIDTVATVATVTSGRRRVRLILASVPFGYRSPEREETDLAAFRELLLG